MASSGTQDESRYETKGKAPPVPGALVIFSDSAPMLRSIPITLGAVRLGRDDAGGQPLPDRQLSRLHLELAFDAPGWTVRTFGKNPTLIDGHPIDGLGRAPMRALVRMARTLFLLSDDLTSYLAANVTSDEFVVGPILRQRLDRLSVAGQKGSTVLITGESGSGKELAAKTFHKAAAPGGPLISVNCSTLDSPLGPATLFGSVKGAFTGSLGDRKGLIEEADGGVLFLDEVADLKPEVQAMLLRAIETREFMPVGATRPRTSDVRFCSATHKDMAKEIAEGRFRHDLFFRLTQETVNLPPLRERREEIPWLIAHALAETEARTPHASLVEAAMLKSWPGNARELVQDIRSAASRAAAQGSSTVRAEHLFEDRGAVLPPRSSAPTVNRPHPSSPTAVTLTGTRRTTGNYAALPAEPPMPPTGKTREELEGALKASNGNVSKAARDLGLHRTQLYREMRRFGIPLKPDIDGESSSGRSPSR